MKLNQQNGKKNVFMDYLKQFLTNNFWYRTNGENFIVSVAFEMQMYFKLYITILISKIKMGE